MHFLIEDDALLEKYNTISDKVSADIKKECDEQVTAFCGKQIPKMNSNHTCLTVISLDSALKKDGSCYPQMF